MKKLLIVSWVVLAVMCFSSVKIIKGLYEEKDRLKQNNDALMEKADYYLLESGKSAASVQALKLSKSEIEKHCSDLTETVKELNVKIKRLQSASTTATRTDVEVKTVVRDSIVYTNAIPDTLQMISWSDNWIRIQGELRKKELSLSIQSMDTLEQIVHRVPKKFLFFRWGTKAIRQEIVSRNPHTKIVYSEYIELKK